MRLRVERLRRDERGRERLVGLLAAPAELERPVLVVDADVELALGLGIDAAAVDLVLLRLEAERVPPGLLLLVRLAVGHEPAERVPVREQLLVVELAVEEVLPPLRPLLALVVVEQVREEPVGVALLGAGEQRVADARPLGVALLGLLAPLALPRAAAAREAPAAAARAASGAARRARRSPPGCSRGCRRAACRRRSRASSRTRSRTRPRRRPRPCRSKPKSFSTSLIE